MRLAAIALLACSCVGASRTPAWERPGLPFGDVSAEILDHMVQQGDAAFAARDKPESLDDAIETWRGALRYRPGDAALLVRLSRACRLRAHTLSSSADADDKIKAAIAYAERALAARNQELWSRANAKKAPHDLFGAAQPPDVPALVAYVEALLDWSIARGTATLLAQRDNLVASATRAVELDRAAGQAAGDRALGFVLGTLTVDLGGDLRASQEHFEAALAEAPGYLPARLAYAESWCVRARDGERYHRLLADVAGADANALPDAAPENRAAQKRAKALLAEAKSW